MKADLELIWSNAIKYNGEGTWIEKHIKVLRALAEMRMWWRDGVIADLDHVATIERVRGESLLTSRYIFMTAMSAGIALAEASRQHRNNP